MADEITIGDMTPRCACCHETRRNETNTWFTCGCSWEEQHKRAGHWDWLGTKCDLHGGLNGQDGGGQSG